MSGDDDSSGWQLTESDPGVFTELLKQLGVPLIVDDLYTLDFEALQALQPLHALIFLFKWIPTAASSNEPNSTAGKPDPNFAGFFAHQVVNNACATLAVLNGVLNIEPTDGVPLPMSSELADLVSFTTGMDPQTRGLAVTSADWLRAAHNALSPPAAVSLDGLIDKADQEKQDAYHFVVYVPVHGAVYELDGLQPFPISHGPWPADAPDGWLSTARAAVERRIATYPPGALEFNLQAVRADPLPRLRAQLAEAQKTGSSAAVAEAAAALADEEAKRERWAFENSLRRHNHLGFIHALVLALAKAGKLDAAKEGAKAKMRERINRARERGMDVDEA